MIPSDATHAYREAAIRGASQIRLVMMMYDMIIDDLQRSLEAIRVNDIEKRTQEIKHALCVIEQLQGTLNMADGGDAAINMDQLYSITRGKLLEASIKHSATILKNLVKLFTELRSAWQQVENQPFPFGSAEPAPEQIPAPIVAVNLVPAEAVSCDWTA
jgi:flagellar secretion chaperone FliS